VPESRPLRVTIPFAEERPAGPILVMSAHFKTTLVARVSDYGYGLQTQVAPAVALQEQVKFELPPPRGP
jgi:hypothetical protein